MKKLRVGIDGAAGFTGGELIRLLLGHPKVEIAAAASSTFPGQEVSHAHPNLRGRTDLVFTPTLDHAKLDCLFLAGGHGDAMDNVPAIIAETGPRLRIIDLSGDFRLRDRDLYPRWYQRTHTSPQLLKKFAYGLVEFNRAEIGRARWVANPGCFATATGLALGPLAKGGVTGMVSVTAITGSSGAGSTPSPVTHHPIRHGSLRAYKPFTHQHIPEIEQLLERLAGNKGLRLSLVPVSGPFSRGIYAVCQVDLPKRWTAQRVEDLYAAAYRGSSFVRLVPEPPALKAVNGSNHCDLFVTVQERRICVISAIDNLVKGASGQAVQNLNVMMGWDEGVGLEAVGVYP